MLTADAPAADLIRAIRASGRSVRRLARDAGLPQATAADMIGQGAAAAVRHRVDHDSLIRLAQAAGVIAATSSQPAG